MQALILHPVPKVKASLSPGDWFRFVFSKLAPLEEWNAILSPEDIQRDRYAIPRFCFRFFRVQPESYASFAMAVREYRGPVYWQLYDSCVGAFSQKVTLYPPLLGGTPEEFTKSIEEAIRNPPKPDPELLRRAIDDIPRFCQYLESQLGLMDKSPEDFDENWLTWDGLQTSRRMFDDFVERGDHMPMLARTFNSDPRRRLSFGISDEEMGSLLSELGAQYSVTYNPDVPVVVEYPLLSRLSDVACGARYRPEEINQFLEEIALAHAIATKPSSVRALDKLHRIAMWANRDDTGVFFSGQ